MLLRCMAVHLVSFSAQVVPPPSRCRRGKASNGEGAQQPEGRGPHRSVLADAMKESLNMEPSARQ
jgi:hypothetical protein